MRHAVVVLILFACVLAAFAGMALAPGAKSSGAIEALPTVALECDPAAAPTVLPIESDSSLLASIGVPESGEFCGQQIPLERLEIRDALQYELILSAGRPLMPMLWTRRAPSVLPMIEAKLAAAGLPGDLKYLAMVESDLRLTVRSPAGALGLWQFMPATAQRYGLHVGRHLDERMDSELATDAAVAHLADLHAIFDDWFLVAAAYNAGESRVKKALESQREESYFDLFLPAETRRYVYRMIAAKMIYTSPEEYGIEPLAPIHIEEFDRVLVEVNASRADLRKLAAERGLRYAQIRRSNPKLISSWLPRGSHYLRIPRASSGSESQESTGADADS